MYRWYSVLVYLSCKILERKLSLTNEWIKFKKVQFHNLLVNSNWEMKYFSTFQYTETKLHLHCYYLWIYALDFCQIKFGNRWLQQIGNWFKRVSPFVLYLWYKFNVYYRDISYFAACLLLKVDLSNSNRDICSLSWHLSEFISFFESL